MKRGPKPGKGEKMNISATIDKALKAEIDKRTENLSGYLNEAGKAYLPKWDKKAKP